MIYRIFEQREPIDPATLTEGEQTIYATCHAESRKHEWLLGRGALKQALRMSELSEDTSLITWPHSRFSITHSGDRGYAVALAENADTPEGYPVIGVGVDYEPFRNLNQKISKFYLQPAEQAVLADLDAVARAKALVALWTVKEALFKATPDNQGRTVKQILLADPLADIGIGVDPEDMTRHYRYETKPEGAGYLTIAFCVATDYRQ